MTEESQSNLSILDLIKCKHYDLPFDKKYIIILANPATGILYVTNTSPFFISGQVRMSGIEKGGQIHAKKLKAAKLRNESLRKNERKKIPYRYVTAYNPFTGKTERQKVLKF